LKIQITKKRKEKEFRAVFIGQWFTLEDQIHLKITSTESFKIIEGQFHRIVWTTCKDYTYNFDAIVETGIEVEEIRFVIP